MHAHGFQAHLVRAAPAAATRLAAGPVHLAHLSGIELPKTDAVRSSDQPAAAGREAEPTRAAPPPVDDATLPPTQQRHHLALAPWQQSIRLVALLRGESDPFPPHGAAAAPQLDRHPWQQRHHAALAPWQRSIRMLALCRGEPDPLPAPGATGASSGRGRPSPGAAAARSAAQPWARDMAAGATAAAGVRM